MAIERSSLPVAVATSNLNKLQRVIEAFVPKQPQDTFPLTAIIPLFDEEAIKTEVNSFKTSGVDYVVAISRLKLAEQRRLVREQEGSEQDYTLLVSDSVLIATIDGKQVAMNRDGETEEDRAKMIEAINAAHEITFTGAVSFGRKNGISSFTTVSYCTVPLHESITDIPKDFSQFQQLKDPEKGIEVGYYAYINREGEGLVPVKKPINTFEDFQQARPYISGLTPEAIRLANETGDFDSVMGPTVQALVDENPFNTMAYYQKQKDASSFYRDLAQNWEEHFDTHGGNCSLFSLKLAKLASGLGYESRIALFPLPGGGEGAEDGHSAVITQSDSGRLFVSDPGLSVPFPTPLDPVIPLVPTPLNGKNKLILVNLGDPNSSPSLSILDTKGKVETRQGRIVTPVEFLDMLPDLLSRLHHRAVVKIDYHRNGDRVFGVSYDRRTKSLLIRAQQGDLEPLTVEDIESLLSGEAMRNIRTLAHLYGVDIEKIIEHLSVIIAQS